MFALSFLAILALASAAPQYARFHEEPFFRPPPPGPPRPHHGYDSSEGLFHGDIFDTRRFWAEMETEMQKVNDMLTEFYKHFPTTSSEIEIEGNEYVVTLNLNGFDEKDIKVKAREGFLMVQAVHHTDDGSERSYLDLKTLPSNVNVNGTWTFDAGVLKIVFPLNSKPVEVTEKTATEEQTQGPILEDRDREEMEPTQSGNVNHDADVGLERGDKDGDSEIMTNVISGDNNVEATTYAVDLKNEVEFVPVKY